MFNQDLKRPSQGIMLNNNQTGKLIVIEGPEGSGKTSLAKLLVTYLNSIGVSAVSSKEPGTAFKGILRNLILEDKPSPVSELFLFLADRAEHIHNHVKPMLSSGTWVVLDRFSHSTVIYQALAKQVVSSQVCYDLCKIAEQQCSPAKTLILNADFETCQNRLNNRQDQVKRIAQQGGDELSLLVFKAYQDIPEDFNTFRLNANLSTDKVLEQAIQILSLNWEPVAQK